MCLNSKKCFPRGYPLVFESVSVFGIISNTTRFGALRRSIASGQSTCTRITCCTRQTQFMKSFIWHFLDEHPSRFVELDLVEPIFFLLVGSFLCISNLIYFVCCGSVAKPAKPWEVYVAEIKGMWPQEILDAHREQQLKQQATQNVKDIHWGAFRFCWLTCDQIMFWTMNLELLSKDQRSSLTRWKDVVSVCFIQPRIEREEGHSADFYGDSYRKFMFWHGPVASFQNRQRHTLLKLVNDQVSVLSHDVTCRVCDTLI